MVILYSQSLTHCLFHEKSLHTKSNKVIMNYYCIKFYTKYLDFLGIEMYRNFKKLENVSNINQ